MTETARITKKFSRRIAPILLWILVPLNTPWAPGQSPAGKLSGTVYDPSGAVLPDAEVLASNPGAGTRDKTRTDGTGHFEFLALPEGTYLLEVRVPGFKVFTLRDVSVQRAEPREENATLEIGSVSEEISVAADSPGPFPGKPLPAEGIRVGGNVKAMKLLEKVQPRYPAAARESGIEGSVLLSGVIDTEGKVVSLKVLNSRIDPALAKAAVDAVSRWVYAPALLNGNPVEVTAEFTVNFQLGR